MVEAISFLRLTLRVQECHLKHAKIDRNFGKKHDQEAKNQNKHEAKKQRTEEIQKTQNRRTKAPRKKIKKEENKETGKESRVHKEKQQNKDQIEQDFPDAPRSAKLDADSQGKTKGYGAKTTALEKYKKR